MNNTICYDEFSGTCPFSFSDNSELVQNYGCLPTPSEIINMRKFHNKTWACHSNPKKPCNGAIAHMKNIKIDYKIVDPKLLTEKDKWFNFINEN